MPVCKKFAVSVVCLALMLFASASTPASSQVPLNDVVPVTSRVVSPVDDTKLVQLKGNTHPQARPEFEKGLVDGGKLLERMVLVLQRSPEQENALADFNARQYDPKSPDFHHWLDAEEFGKLYGPSDSDVTAVTSWLQNHGFSIDLVSKGRVTIQFTGTAAQVQDAFHVEMHNYLVNGQQHISNDRDPQIPEALRPVVAGIASLNNFFPKHYSHPGNYVKRDLKTGKYTELKSEPAFTPVQSVPGFPGTGKGQGGGARPEFGYVDPNTGYQREMLSPYDVATIYNILPLWNQSTPINGKGVKVAIVGLSDVATSDFNTFRSSFGLPAGTLTTLHSGSDPGLTDSQGENTEDVEMVSSTAPGAQVVLVADVDNATTNGLITAITYIVENKVAPILTMSYGECELGLGSAGNSLWNSTFQQAATAGISAFVAAGDSGSAVCTSQNGNPPYADSFGLAVSGMASTPYATAVGGTDLAWPFSSQPYTTWWNTTNDSHGASAKGYMPEVTWNDTCTDPLLLNVYAFSNNEDLCNAAINGNPGLVEMGAGSGGVSQCTTPSGATSASCKGGYAKPSWQTGTGVPSDGKRDLPDVSMFAAYGFQNSTGIPGSALLICQSSGSPENSCDYSNPNYIIYQENGGTSAASPLTAGIMALVIQKTGSAQGLANPVFYKLAASENLANCNSNTVTKGNSCIFYDTTSGSNAMVCYTGDTDCVTNTSGDQAGILTGYNAGKGYDLTTGLGSFNVANLVNSWPTSGTSTPAVSLSASSLSFPSTRVGSVSATQAVTVTNTGNAVLDISSITNGGTSPTSFYVPSRTCGTTLAAGASCTLNIGFRPKASGTLTGTISLNDNAANTPQVIAVSGTGVASPVVVFSKGTLSFPSTPVGGISATQQVTLTNTGDAVLHVNYLLSKGTNASSFFTPSNTCEPTVAAGASCTINIAFRPKNPGTLTGTIYVNDNAAGSEQGVNVSGTGVAAPLVTLSPTSLAFPSTKVGSVSAAQSVTVKNVGYAALDVSYLSAAGTDASSFYTPSNGCHSSLAVGATCTFSVAFRPKAAGALSGSIAIHDNAANSPQNLKVSGTGTN
jgi:hypothetical protein